MGEPAYKKRRVSPSDTRAELYPAVHSDTEDQPIAQGDFFKRASQWNLEQDYEQRPRKQKKGKESNRLPIKTAEGRIEQLEPTAEDDGALDSSADELEEDTPDTIVSDDGEAEVKPKVSVKEQILQAKEELARIAALINEAPEDHIGSLKVLAQITSSEVSTITKLGLATQLAVYKDIIPGYRIRPLKDEETNARISKEVRKLRSFEQSIVKGYQKYVSELGRIAALGRAGVSEETASLATVAVSCACNLVTSVPHFNFRGDLLKILSNKLAGRERNVNFDSCCKAIEKLFAEDEEGNASLEAVSLLAKMFKAKDYRVDERVLNLFLHLRLLTEFLHKGSTDRIDKTVDTASSKKPKQTREFRTKKMRKIMKERKTIEKEMQEADAVVSHEQRDQLQAETLKLVFGVYFRILKARTPSLMGPVLEGLVKYAHLINQDFFGDLLEALKDLIREAEQGDDASNDENAEEDDTDGAHQDDNTPARNITRESLLCVITAFALLQGQDGATAATTLNLDLTFFITHLYRTLYPAALNADIELSSKSLHLPDPDASSAAAAAAERTKVNVQTTVVLLLRSLHAVLLPANARSVPPVRLAAFTKQILTAALNLPEKSCTAMLGLVNQVVKMHKRRVVALWNSEERRGDGVFDPLSGRVEGSNPFAATVWEGELLRLHYAPAVRDGVKNLEELVKE